MRGIRQGDEGVEIADGCGLFGQAHDRKVTVHKPNGVAETDLVLLRQHPVQHHFTRPRDIAPLSERPGSAYPGGSVIADNEVCGVATLVHEVRWKTESRNICETPG
ncbi:Uncharacterised protein [Mycobacteroides abscessus]|nr:Uncharacterised protein [Mycobacteroides abscessus]